jgi:tetratricopeptide (TPR) repeat protein
VSETYDRTLDDIFVVQDDIAGEVVKSLKLTLLGPTPIPRSKPVDSEAYNLALQGRFFLERRSRKDLERAIEYFRRSLEHDPGYAPAWAGLSQAYARQADNGYVPAADGYGRAREAAEKSLALDPQLVDAHLAMGGIQRSHDWDWAAASYRKALDLEPGNALALRYAGVQATILGRWNEAIDLANKAIERDPLRRAPTAASATCSWRSSANALPNVLRRPIESAAESGRSPAPLVRVASKDSETVINALII